VHTCLLRDLVEKYLHVCPVSKVVAKGLSTRELGGAWKDCWETRVLVFDFGEGVDAGFTCLE